MLKPGLILQVYVGENLNYTVGSLHYRSDMSINTIVPTATPGTTSTTSETMTTTIIIITAVVIAIVVVFVVIIVIICVVRKKSRKQTIAFTAW